MERRTKKIFSPKEELISIIIPVYNVEDYLEKCLTSIVSQSYRNLQIILVNDGSTDGSARICQSFMKRDERIEYYEQKNAGLSAARNTGIKKAKGDFLTFIDSDDNVDLDYIEYLHTLITKNNADMAVCGLREKYEKGKIIVRSKGHNDTLLNRTECLKRMLLDQGFNCSAYAKLYKRSLWGSLYYPVSKQHEDLGTTYKYILKCQKIAYGREAKYEYYIRKGSISHSKYTPEKISIIKLTDQMCDDIEKEISNSELHEICELRRMHARLSVLRMMPLRLSQSNKVTKNRICNYIKEKSKNLSKSNYISKRERIAILTAKKSFTLYRISWSLYQFIAK